jgi:hypothetical protein
MPLNSRNAPFPGKIASLIGKQITFRAKKTAPRQVPVGYPAAAPEKSFQSRFLRVRPQINMCSRKPFHDPHLRESRL